VEPFTVSAVDNRPATSSCPQQSAGTLVNTDQLTEAADQSLAYALSAKPGGTQLEALLSRSCKDTISADNQLKQDCGPALIP
jgi:hypothetical protein